MRPSILYLLIIPLFCSITGQGQKKFSEGTIVYNIMINTGQKEPKKADFLDGATSTVFIKGNKCRTDMVSSIGTQSTIIDAGKNSVVILKEFGEQHYLINLTSNDWKDANKKYEGINYTYDPSATKMILGYSCQKATGKLEDGTTFTVWFTPDLIVENKDFQYANRTLSGLALEYETELGKTKVTYTVSKLTFNPVQASKFDIPKNGFRVMTYAESKGKS